MATRDLAEIGVVHVDVTPRQRVWSNWDRGQAGESESESTDLPVYRPASCPSLSLSLPLPMMMWLSITAALELNWHHSQPSLKELY